MKKLFCVVLISLFLIPSIACANNEWEFRIFGVNINKDIKDINWGTVILASVSSLMVHEYLGHYLVGEAFDMEPSFDLNSKAIVCSDYMEKSKDQRFMFNSAGFMAQFVVGGLLTAIPQTRHSDFNLWFNAFTFAHNTLYVVTGDGTDEEYSDIYEMTKHGMDGHVIGGLFALTAEYFAYIASKK